MLRAVMLLGVMIAAAVFAYPQPDRQNSDTPAASTTEKEKESASEKTGRPATGMDGGGGLSAIPGEHASEKTGEYEYATSDGARLELAQKNAAGFLADRTPVKVENPHGGSMDLTPLLKRIADGESDPHRNDGSEFRNYEHRLPRRPNHYYTEFVDRSPSDRSPGAQRLIIGQDGDIWYTFDHYESFIQVNP